MQEKPLAWFNMPRGIATLVFIVSAIACGVIGWLIEDDHLRNLRAEVVIDADGYAREIQGKVQHAMSPAYALAALLKLGNGSLLNFEQLAPELMALNPDVISLSLSPGGIVRQIVPLAGNEKAIGLDQLNDAQQGKEARAAMASGKLSVAGPVTLVEGGIGLVGRLPVFLTTRISNESTHFWGFANVVVKFPDILESVKLGKLSEGGFAYALWRLDPKTQTRQVIVGAPLQQLDDPVQVAINIPNGTWTLSVSPLHGWRDAGEVAAKVALSLVLSGLLALVTKLLAEARRHERELEATVAARTSAIVEREAQLRVAATAFASHEGMMVTDTRQIIIKVNQAFTDITQFASDEVIGKTPGILKSGRHDAEFYQSMWEGLSLRRFWQGEIWNRRKNGDVFPEWLSITAVTDESDQVTNYVASFSDITKRKDAEETIHQLAFYDPLTKIPNRRLLYDRLQQIVLATTQEKLFGAILVLDLDDFKVINDTQGHAVGDMLLVEVANRIQRSVHADDTVARNGSNSFIVVLKMNSDNVEHASLIAQAVAERVHACVALPFDLAGLEFHPASSVGITLFHGQIHNAAELLRMADSAIHQAKKSGRNSVRFFDPKIQEGLALRTQMESLLRKAIPSQLRLYYQLQVDSSDRVLGAEVLVRWQHPDQGMVSPAAFIPLAEETGLILPMGLWVLETACKQLKVWETDIRKRHLTLAVNVSAKQFHQTEFVQQVMTVLEQTGADPIKLKLELTESLLLESVEVVIEKMTQLKKVGVRFSLDDFGIGYSSLAYLKRLPLDQLKIDQSFVRDLTIDANDAAIVRAVIVLGNSLGLSVIAEGVETAEQRNFLAVHGCTQYQGYLFSKPLPLDAFEELLRELVPPDQAFGVLTRPASL
jgi:diguanylate cyclase (GGDEF)-like protein/PAS domain S-box-containing protein